MLRRKTLVSRLNIYEFANVTCDVLLRILPLKHFGRKSYLTEVLKFFQKKLSKMSV